MFPASPRLRPAPSLILAFITGAAGCASDPSSTHHDRGPATRLSPADFAAPENALPPGVTLSNAPPGPAPADAVLDINAPTPANTTGPLGAGDGVYHLVTNAGDAPTAPPPNAGAPSGDPSLVDAKVGDINGKPIYASVFFDTGSPTIEPLGPRLAAQARQVPAARWRSEARDLIHKSLDGLIEDELLRAEAYATLSPEQKAGFINFLQRLQGDLQRKSGGSRERLDEELQREMSMSLDQFMKQREQRELINFALTQKIEKRVSVTFADIRRAYDKYYDQLNPPPRYRFSVISVPKNSPADAAEVEKKLADATPFEEIAKSPLNRWHPDVAGVEERELKGDRATFAFFGSDAMNNAARTLEVGKVAGPLDIGSSLAWLRLDNVKEIHVGLYDAQLALETRLRAEKAVVEKARYLDRLRRHASMTPIDQMESRLLEIAEARYLPKAAR